MKTEIFARAKEIGLLLLAHRTYQSLRTKHPTSLRLGAAGRRWHLAQQVKAKAEIFTRAEVIVLFTSP